LDSHAEIFKGPTALTDEWVARGVVGILMNGVSDDSNKERLEKIYGILDFDGFFESQRTMI